MTDSTPTLSLADHVGWTWRDAATALDPLGLEREPRPPELTRLAIESPPLEVDATAYLTAAGHLSLRYARIRTVSADVATVMVYPLLEPSRYPVFAAEWVVIGARVHVAVLDVEPVVPSEPLRARLAASFLPLAERWREALPRNRTLPAWFREIATPWAIYAALPLSSLTELRAAYGQYLHAVVERFYASEPPREAPRQEEHPAVLAYKRHHHLHSPGRKMLAAKLGESWTEDFLRCHFGLSPRPPKARRNDSSSSS